MTATVYPLAPRRASHAPASDMPETPQLRALCEAVGRAQASLKTAQAMAATAHAAADAAVTTAESTLALIALAEQEHARAVDAYNAALREGGAA